jgi:hypothetical protein
MGFASKITSKEFKPHAPTHHIVIILVIVIIGMLTLCHPIMSHATPILFLSSIHVNTTVGYNMLTNSFGPEISAQYVGTLRSSRRCKNDPIRKSKVALESQKREIYKYDNVYM